MIRQVPISEFLSESKNIPIVDARTPAEFEQGHIPGAHNIPLFSNSERAIIGTTYKQKSREQAILEGLDFVGPKMSGFVLQAEKIAPDKKIALHCWRGGMRSGSMAWLFNMMGFEVLTLIGGYKSFRKVVLQTLEENWPLRVVGGMTGSGKTEILQVLKKQGEQVVDLEDLAQHCGSAFGSMGIMVQPSQEHFENMLYTELASMDFSKPVWVEDESANIGKIILPRSLRLQIKSATVIKLEIPLEQRIAFLVKQYGKLSPEFLKESITKIQKKLGPQHAKSAVQAVDDNDFALVAEIALKYYDKTYQTGLNHRNSVQALKLDDVDAKRNAVEVLKLIREGMIGKRQKDDR